MMPVVGMTALKDMQLSLSFAELAEINSIPRHRNSPRDDSVDPRTAMILVCLDTAQSGAG